MSRLDIQILGGFSARIGTGENIWLPTRKVEALLAYLALAPGKTRSRDQIVGLLWSDRSESQAKSSLRQALTSLRHGFQENGSDILTTKGESVVLNPSSVVVDVQEFEKLAANGSNGNLARAEKLYQGPLLDGLNVRDPAFNEWLSRERTRVHELAISAVDRLLAGLLRNDDREAAIAAALRLLALDPLRESTYRTLMRLYAAQDQRGLAARQFEQCREILTQELNIEPSPATTGLYEQIVGSCKGDAADDAAPRRVTTPLPLPSKPSVVILPFANLSGDPQQTYLSDGLTEDVIAELSRFSSLFVIGPESALALKNRLVGLPQVARDLGVEYVVEGSVRKAGDTLRVTVQLIDPITGYRLWAERYDRPFAEVFDIQDEIVGNIAGALSVNIEHTQRERIRGRPKESLDAYEYCVRAKEHIWKATPDGYTEAMVLFQKAVELDPGYAPGWVGLARVFNKDGCFSPGIDLEESITKARQHAEMALSLDRKSGSAYAQLARVHLNLREYKLARQFLDEATNLAPNESEVLATRSMVLCYLGDLDQAVKAADYGLRINPYDPDYYLDAKGTAYFFMERYEDAWKTWSQVSQPAPVGGAWYAASLAYLGESAAAQRKFEEFVLAIGAIWQGDPKAGPKDFARWVTHFDNPTASDEHRRRLIEGVRLAGLSV